MRFFIAPLVISLLLMGCAGENNKQKMNQPSIKKAEFGTLPDGSTAHLYTLTNAHGVYANITNYGGIVTHLFVPDKAGKLADVVLGFDSLQPYLDGHPFFGALVGRYGNRIAKGQFSLEGKTYNLFVNDGPNTLHGGEKGFDKVLWEAKTIESDSSVSLELFYKSADMEEGYPGNLSVRVTYTLSDDNTLTIAYHATTDQPTVVNLTNHSYFNLTGLKSDILTHEVSIHGDSLVAVDEKLIPTGELIPVAGTPFDFRTPRVVGERIDDTSHEQIRFGGGYDHCWVLNRDDHHPLRQIATVYDAGSGRLMEVLSTEPGVQFYTGNFLDGSLKGKGAVYTKRFGLCLETQHYPDSPNQPHFPSTILRPGETYETTTAYRFSIRE